MSTKRLRACTCNGTTADAPPPSLPVDLLLEIVSRSDVATVLRCAATSKPLRGAILDQDFCRRLALLAAANGGFDPRLLLGVSYRLKYWGTDRPVPVCVVQTPPSSQPLPRLCGSILEPFQPVVSRDGLIVLEQEATGGDHRFSYYNNHLSKHFNLYVCNTFTGHVTPFLPRMAVNSDIYPPALLTVGDAGHSFELLVTGSNLRTQTFSSQDGKWGAVRAAHLHPLPSGPVHGSLPAVIGRTVHWLSRASMHPLYTAYDMIILALHADTARATTIELPQRCVRSMLGCAKSTKELLLGASADGRLRLVVAEREVISVWTLSSSSSSEEEPTKRWSRQVVIDRPGIDRQLTGWGAYGSIWFGGFGERSGAVLLQMQAVGLVQLNLGTKEAVVIHRIFGSAISQPCLHEIDMASLLRALGDAERNG